jgi:alcohol dehydrogenase
LGCDNQLAMSQPNGGPREIRKFVVPELVLGDETCRLAGQYAFNLGIRHALLVTDPGVSAAGWTEIVRNSLRGAGVAVELFDRVSENPRADEVMTGVEVYKSVRCDGLVVVGGGSPIDAAKGIGIVATNGQEILGYEGVDRIDAPIPPLICVPTTGSAADVSQFAIITDPPHRLKRAIISKALVPDVSILDPCTVTTLPKQLTAGTGMDALVHALEAFVSNASSPVTDLLAREAMALVPGGLPRSIDALSDVRAREVMMRASLLAGMAFSNAILGAVHALAHGLGGLLDVRHVECNAHLVGHVIRFNFEFAAERYRQIAELFGVDVRGRSNHDVCEALVSAIGDLSERVGLEGSLASMGVGKSDIPQLARHAMEDPCLVTNPRPATLRDLEVILEEAL